MASVETQKIIEANQLKNDLISEDVRNSLEQIFSKIFSKEVCDQSKYFQPLLNASYELAIDSIVKAPIVRNILSDDELLKNAILSSKSFHVRNDMVRSSVPVKLEQNTLILRDISSAAPSGDIVGIFTNAVCSNGQPCPSAQSVRSDMNDTWFVTFSSEENAKTALSAIKDCKYNDKVIRARLKTESSMKSYFNVPAGGNNPLQLAMDFSAPSSSGPNSLVSTPTARAGMNSQPPQQVPLSSSGAAPIPGASLEGIQAPIQFGVGPPPSAYGNLFFPAGYPVPPPPHQFMQQGGYPMAQHQQQFTQQQQHMLLQQHQQQGGNPFSMPVMPMPPGSMLPMLTPQQMQQHQQQAFLYMQANPAAAAAYLAMQQQQHIGGNPFVLNPQTLNGGMVNASPQQQNGKGNNNYNRQREGNKFNNGRGSQGQGQGGNGNYSQQGGRNNNGQFRQQFNNNNGQHQQQQRGPNGGGFVNYSSQGAPHGQQQQQQSGSGGPFIQRSYSADSQGNERPVFHSQPQNHFQQQQQQQQQQLPQNFNRNIAPTIEVPPSSSAAPVVAGAVSSDTSSDVTDVSKLTGSSSGNGGGSGVSGSGSRSPKPRQTEGSGQPRQSNGAKTTSSNRGAGGAAPGVDVAAGTRSAVNKDGKVSGLSSVDGATSSGEGNAKKALSSGGDSSRPRQSGSGGRDGVPKTKEGAVGGGGAGKDKRSTTGAPRGPKRDEKGGAQSSAAAGRKPPAIEFNMEADFPILIENEVGASSVVKSTPPASSVWGLPNSVKKFAVPDAPLVVKAAPSSSSSSGKESGKGKGKNKEANKVLPVEVAPVVVVAVEPVDVLQTQVQVASKADVVSAVESGQQKPEPPHVAVSEVCAATVPVAPVSVLAVPVTLPHIAVESKVQISAPVPVLIPACITAAEKVFTDTAVASAPGASTASTPPVTAAGAAVGAGASPSEDVSSWGAKKSFVDILRHASK